MSTAVEKIAEKSELSLLLHKNACTDEGITQEEKERAKQLIANPEFSEKVCWLCEMTNRKESAIFDTNMCQSHAYHVLATRK